jgi:glycerophosphoryl diester phosphodiesterase
VTAGGTLRLAHRGDWRVAPENSVAALVAALAIPKCDGVEFDVRTSRDKLSALLHDETLERVHGRVERPRDLTLQQLQDAGLSTLEEALAAIGNNPFIDIEVKDGPANDFFGLVDRARGPALRNTVISSFDAAVLHIVRGQRPDWPLWLNAPVLDQATLRLAHDLGCRGISAEWHSIDEASLALARDAGIDVATWTVTRKATFDRLARLDIVAICVEGAALDG